MLSALSMRCIYPLAGYSQVSLSKQLQQLPKHAVYKCILSGLNGQCMQAGRQAGSIGSSSTKILAAKSPHSWRPAWMDLLHPAACCSGSISCSCCVKVATCFDYNSWHNKTKLAVCLWWMGGGRCGVKASGNANVIEQLQRQQEQWHAAGSRQLPFLDTEWEREGERAGTVVEGPGLRLLKSAG